jgi:hypothetical protein
MISLYDYLGRAAGCDLGKQVKQFANSRRAKQDIRFVSNPKYTGKVMLYERELLDEFFNQEKSSQIHSVSDDLPF